jgi:hypothetical protein
VGDDGAGAVIVLGRRVRASRSGGYELRLPATERKLIAGVVAQLDTVLSTGELPDTAARPGLWRLFPPAYPTDVESEAEFESYSRADLVEHHRAALRTVTETLDAKVLDYEQASGWLGALNDLRLVLGTVLDVSDEPARLPPSHPQAAQLAVYNYLGVLVSELVDALEDALPDPVAGADERAPEDPAGPRDGIDGGAGGPAGEA